MFIISNSVLVAYYITILKQKLFYRYFSISTTLFLIYYQTTAIGPHFWRFIRLSIIGPAIWENYRTIGYQISDPNYQIIGYLTTKIYLLPSSATVFRFFLHFKCKKIKENRTNI